MEQKLELRRKSFKDTYTIGKLYLNDVYVCDTLEDHVRDFSVSDLKVWGQTAIPTGTFKVTKEIHKKFGNCFRVHNVPYFEGIMIHSGNTAEDTHGCILVGFNKIVSKVIDSKKALEKLFSLIPNQSSITITVKNI